MVKEFMDKYCLFCNKILSNRQTKFCSYSCHMKYERRKQILERKYNPKNNKIQMIKELRQSTNWPLKASKAVAEYLMAYDLLTNPNSRKILQKIQYGV